MSDRTFKYQPWSDTMLLLLGAWLCALPFIVWLVVPGFGWGAGISVALGALLGVLIVCWWLCGRHIPRR